MLGDVIAELGIRRTDALQHRRLHCEQFGSRHQKHRQSRSSLLFLRPRPGLDDHRFYSWLSETRIAVGRGTPSDQLQSHVCTELAVARRVVLPLHGLLPRRFRRVDERQERQAGG